MYLYIISMIKVKVISILILKIIKCQHYCCRKNKDPLKYKCVLLMNVI